MHTTNTYKVNKIDAEVLKQKLAAQGWGRVSDGNPYMDWKVTKAGGFLSMYTSGKLVFQGDETRLDEIDGLMNGSKSTHSHNKNSEKNMGYGGKVQVVKGLCKLWGASYIGCDETGKGEFYGPLVTAACFLDKNQEQEIIKLGIRDSKKVADEKVKKLAKELEQIAKSSIVIMPTNIFNSLMEKEKNIAIVLSIAHSRSIAKLTDELSSRKISFKDVVVDKYSKKEGRLENVMKQLVPRFGELEITQEEHGEAYPAVAAASILARANFLYQVEQIEETYGVKLPHGYSQAVQFGREFQKKFGRDELNKIAKLSFKTGAEI